MPLEMNNILSKLGHLGKVASLSMLFLLVVATTSCQQLQDSAQSAFSQSGPKIYGEGTIGQTFTVNRNNLTRVDVMMATFMRPQSHPVIFTLKESPAASEELARVVADPFSIQDNVLYPFIFAPIPDSAGKSYYFEIQSPTATSEDPVTVWYQPGNVYPDGEGYVDGQPVTDADIAFRTFYDVGSFGQAISYLWSRLPEGKPGIWGVSLFYGILFTIYGILIVVFAIILFKLGWERRREQPNSQTGQWTLARQLLFLLLAITLVRGVIYSSVTYPWQVPDEHGHFEYARILAEQRQIPTPKDISIPLQQKILASMESFDFWRIVGRAMPEDPPPYFDAAPYLRNSRPQIGDEPPLYYLLPALSYAFTRNQSIALQLYVMRLISVFFLVATVWICALIARELFTDDPLLAVTIPTLVAFMPMVVYIGTGVNNDLAAAAAASIVLLLLIQLYRQDFNWWRLTWLIVAVVIALLVKKTNLFLVPTVMVAAILYVMPYLKQGPWLGYLIRGAAISIAGLLILMFGLSQIPTNDAKAWWERPRPWMATRSQAYSKTDASSFHIKDDSLIWPRSLMQTIPGNKMKYLVGQTVTLSAWVRSERGEQPGMLIIKESDKETTKNFIAGPTWTQVSVSHPINPQAVSLDIMVVAGSRAHESLSELYIDDLILSVDADSTQENLLVNGSAEIPQNLLQALPEYLRVYFGVPINMGSRFLDARYYTPVQIQFYLSALRYGFNSFWARFAQQAISVSNGWYSLWKGITFLAFIGIIIKLLRSSRKFAAVPAAGRPNLQQTNILYLMGIALLIISLQTILPTIRLVRNWMPQGRYVFPAIVPISVFLAAGLQQLFPKKLHDLAAPGLIILMGTFDTVVLFYYLIPHFYS